MQTTDPSSPGLSGPRLREIVFTMVAEGRLPAAEARTLIDRFEAPAPATGSEPAEPIAVIGMAGRFGDCPDLEAYWEMIASGGDCIRPLPEGRWSDDPGGAVGGFLEDPGLFDPLFFKISPSEAGLMDPQQRLFLETAYLALEDAALSEQVLAGSACGVFVGTGAGDYGQQLEAAGVGDAPLALMGNVASILAARIAYLLDLKGPALAVDTACSSSLVAVHLACDALRRGDCELAVAGGVCVINSGRFLRAMSQAGMMSPSGRCHTFDQRADGFVCGEGAGAVVLKPLRRALADRDPVHGVILGHGINQDGRTNGITAPSAPAQEALERAVYRRFAIDPAAIGYVEAHGTGTPLGDPIEVEALGRAFGDRTGPRIPLGSVKTNIGHALTAAGIAGLLKVLLMLRAERIPPAPDFKEANPRLGLGESGFRVVTAGESWHAGAGRRLATVSSFGFSGTNAHLVVAEAPPRESTAAQPGPLALLLSARDGPALARRAGSLARHLRRHPELDLTDLALTLATGRTPMARRAALVVTDQAQALAGLDRLAQAESVPAPAGADDPMADLARTWLGGADPDSAAYAGLDARRVSLPGYPLERVPCRPPAAVAAHGNTAAAVPPTASDALARVRQATADLAAEPDPALNADGGAFARVEDWGRRAAATALREADLGATGRRVLTRAALARAFRVDPVHRGLFDALLPILERAGVLVLEGDLVRFAAPAAVAGSAALEAEALALAQDNPATQPFLQLLRRTTRALPGVLRGETEGSAVLFPEGRLDLVAAIYRGNRLADHFNSLMGRAVATLARHRLDGLQGQGSVEILEVGAGTGGATAAILDALGPLAGKVRYHYTDVSLGFLRHGRDSFGDAVVPALLDLTEPPEPQGYATGSMHILVASNVLHAVPELDPTLRQLWRLLAPGGALVLNEVTRVQDFATLTFGLTEGWWAFRDPARRLPHAPLADIPRWRTMLAGAGFPQFLALGLPGTSDEAAHTQAVLVAGRDQAVAEAAPVGRRTGLPDPQAVQAAIPAPAGDALGAVELVIREQVAQTLGMDPVAVDPRGRFMDYGVDSILGLDLVNRLNRRFATDLGPSVVFERPTIADLAAHLVRDHGVGAVSANTHETPVTTPMGGSGSGPEPIAVIGMAGRFADSGDLEAFHRLLAEGRSGISDARRRLGVDPDNPPEHLRSTAPYLRWGGLLQNIERFDPMFFRISGREAELTDPQHRIFLTELWRTLEDAGYSDRAMEGVDCGIFVGCHGGDYTHLMADLGIVPDSFAFTGNAASILAARIAYLLDLKGPSIAVDTACSSSLVAVHLACQALRAGECGMALAGGVFVNTTVGFNTAAASAGMLSPRGRCAAFDAEADGFVPGEGAGAVLLKPLSRAQADGDNIVAVILGSATNQDGKTNGITAPNPASQADLIRRAQARAGIRPEQVAYVETHGTGTRLGDPIEVEGLTRAFAASGLAGGSGACLLGSVKSNVGHAAHAAGIAGLIKTLLSFRHSELYPSLHFHTPNPALALERTPFAVNTELRPWRRPDQGRRVAGVSSFGFSGTNCHVLLADPETESEPPVEVPAGALIPLSARSPAALERCRADLARWLERHPAASLADIAYTLGEGRSHFDCRWATVTEDIAALAEALRAPLDHARANGASTLDPVRREALAEAARRYLAGGLPDFGALAAGGRRIPLPGYPFEERPYWLTAPTQTDGVTRPAGPAQSAQPPAEQRLPRLLTPLWRSVPALPPQAGEDWTLWLTGGPERAGDLTRALQALGARVAPMPDGPPRDADSAAHQALVCQVAADPGDGDSTRVLAPVFELLRRMSAGDAPDLPVILVHDGSPLAAAAIAAAPSLRFVREGFRLRAVALAPDLPGPRAAALLLSELPAREPEVRIDAAGARQVRELAPLELVQNPGIPAGAGGVWLITGGLGGLGPHLARHLAIGRGARVGLIGRSPLQGERAERLKRLRADGVQAHYVAADVADPEALGTALAEIEGLLGPVDGVLHAAGVPSLRPLQEASWADLRATLRAKVDGTLCLDRLLADRPLRAFVLFSSLAGEFGDFGQCDYAIANAFLGRYAAWRNAEVAAGRRAGRTLALAWPIWEDGHAALGADGGALMSKALGIPPLGREAGLRVLDLTLAGGDVPPEILVMTGQGAERRAEEETRPAPAAATPVAPAPVGADPQAGVRADLAGVIAGLLRLDAADLRPDAGLGDFGFDSIALKEFSVLLTDRYGVEISPAVFFAHGTIAALAEHICQAHPDAVLRVLGGPGPETPQAAPVPTPVPEPGAAAAPHDDAIAIVGMAGRFPGSRDLDEFWADLAAGGVRVGPMPDGRRRLLGLAEEESPLGGFLDDIESFDHGFFRVSRRDAVHMDPQHRLALEVLWEALSDAAIVPESLAGRPVGVFLGQQVSGYAALLQGAGPETLAQSALGNVAALMPNRISYLMDLRGPSEAVDTACSSALVAVHRAVRALRGGECELALAGAASLLLNLDDLRSTESLGVLSPDGICHSFDARANGYVKGEGVGVVVLKPLARALADGDPIHAVIRGSAVNHGGRAQSLTAPNPKAQADLIRAALADAGVAAETIGYLEAHGTGTELGDPIEVEALKEVFGNRGHASDDCAIGSVKANIGHLEPAAGIAGLIKTVLALEKRERPALAGLETPNPYIDLQASPLFLPRETAPWPRSADGGPRRAGISAFGFGGANAHLVLEQAPDPAPRADGTGPAQTLLVLSAPTTAQLAGYARRLAARLAGPEAPALGDLSHTLRLGRPALAARATLLAMDSGSAVQGLEALAAHLDGDGERPGNALVGNAGAGANPLGGDRDDQALFAQLAARGRLDRIAQLWVTGAQVDWAEVPGTGGDGRLVHLPAPPLQRVRCWVEPATAGHAAPSPATSAPLTAATPVTGPATDPATGPDPAEVSDRIRAIVAAALYIEPEQLDEDTGFMDLGLDSILAVEVTRAINQAFGLQLQAARLYDHPTVRDLAARVQEWLGVGEVPPGPHSPSAMAPADPPPTAPSPADTAPTAAPTGPHGLREYTETIREVVAKALYITPDELDDRTGFTDLGLDSILAVEVANTLNQALGADLQATRLYDHPSVEALARHLMERRADAPPPATASPDGDVTDQILGFLGARVAQALGVEVTSTDPGAPLDRLGLSPEQATAILEATATRYGCALAARDVAGCRDLGAVARLVAARCAAPPVAQAPVPTSDAPARTASAAPGLAEAPIGRLQEIRADLAELLRLPPAAVETDLPLVELGLDPVLAHELADRLARRYGGSAPGARELLAAPSLAALAAVPRQDAGPAAAPQPSAAPASSPRAADPAVPEVAVVGMACRFPGAPDKDAFWDLLLAGRSGITRVPADRWNPADHASALDRPERRSALEWGGFVDRIDRFDPLFFNLSPREAELMDPQQRLFLEEAWHAFEDAGLPREALRGARCGVFIGGGQGDYSRNLPVDDPAQVTGQLLLGNTSSILVSRISYLLDLQGPALAVDTACSSALVAADLGFRAIRDGGCDLALVGGVNLMTTPQMHLMTAASGMLAPDGQCRTFDDEASGFVPGEGIGLLVLRRLDHALAGGDRIYGLIRGSGSNQDGKTSGITAPSSTAQERLQLEVWRRYGIDPGELGYVEAHGTGTRLGDPIEIDALTRAFAAHTQRRQDCPIGSVKTNIGHTLAAAGAASLIKTLLSLHHRVIPPSLNFRTPNRHIDFPTTPFFVPGEPLPWRERRLAAVSSFGFSGTNAHMILGAPPPPRPAAGCLPPGRRLCFPLSARDRSGLARQAARLAAHLGSVPTAAPLDVAHTLACRRSQLENRLVVVSQDLAGLIEALEAFGRGRQDGRLVGPGRTRRDPPGAHCGDDPADPVGLAKDWIQGASVPWAEVQPGGGFIDLPTTAFADQRCWIDRPDGPAPAPPAAAAEPVATPSGARWVLTGESPVMANHRVAGRPILPGMASLALLRAEARRRGYHGPLSAIAWRLPVAAPAGLDLECAEDGGSLEVALVDTDGRRVAQARARRSPLLQPPAVDLAALKEACRETVAPEAVYRRLEAGGVVHGPGFRLLEQIHIADGQVLVQLAEADPGAWSPLDAGGLPPALLDSALQALGALDTPLGEASSAQALLPAAARRLAQYAPIDGPVTAWLVVDRSASGADRLVADLRLLDRAGEVLTELLGFEARPGAPPDRVRAPAPAPVREADRGGTLLALRPRWVPGPVPLGPAAGAPLVLHGREEAPWAQRLAAEHGGRAVCIDGLDPETLVRLAAETPAADTLLLAAWRGDEANPSSLEPGELTALEQRGVHTLHALFRGLARRAGPGRLVVVTRRVQRVLTADRPDPAFGALPGFARSAARELPRLQVSCVDLDREAADEEDPAAARRCRDWLMREATDALVAYREGRRLHLGMTRLDPAPTPSGDPPVPLPARPVCLLLGGAGGLGRAAARRLAERRGARIALVGRRAEDPDIRTVLAELRSAGGEAVYLRADATDPAALAAAVAEVRRQWGRIHLAVHAALVLKDRLVTDMDSADLDQVLAPKSHGLNNLIRALAEDPPDLLCLFSSANGFTVNPGQANYAAGCTFVDALALAQEAHAGWPVRVIDWGIWGETGVVAQERYLERARRAGVVPLGTDEALDLFEGCLARPLPQVVAVKVAERSLADMQAGLVETLSYSAAATELAIQGAIGALDTVLGGTDPGQLAGPASAFTALIQHGRERLFRIYAALGLDRAPTAPLSAVAERLGIVPEQRGLFAAHLDILARSGWVRLTRESEDEEPRVQPTGGLPGGPDPALPASAAELPNASRLLDAALSGTAEVLTGRRPATEVLFPGGRGDLVEGVYADEPAARLFNQALAEAAAGLGRGRPLSVIEIGAGTGASTRTLLQALDRAAPGTCYLYTDLSPHFVAAGKDRFGSRPNARFQVLDIGLHPGGQGVDPGGFDLVIAANVLHALPDCARAVGHAKALLKPGGALLLLEATAPSDFATLIFGLTDGWWAFRDPEARLPHGPLLSVGGWRVVLETQGLRLAGLGQIPGNDAQSILLAVSDGWVAGAASLPAEVPRAQPAPGPRPVPGEGAPPDILALAAGDLALALGMGPDQIDPEEPLERYGVDSLVSTDVHGRLEQRFGALPREIVFEAVTLRGLAERLAAALPETAPRPAFREDPPSPNPVASVPGPAADPADEAIAVIGIAGRYPGADSVQAFWDNLEQGRSHIGPMAAQRLALWPEAADAPGPGGYLNGVDGFDPLFFAIAPNEAAAMDPQERLFLETAWAALEDAGRRPTDWDGRVGVFVGVMGQDYLRLGTEHQARGGTLPGDSPAWSIANRVSHVLDLRGPSLAAGTACSSTLTALHLACESLRAGGCDAALAGGVHLVLHPASRQGLAALGMLSASGRARPFGADADGMVGGEGVGCLVLRRLADALVDGDRILGVVRATGLGANGRARAYMAPTAEGQGAALAEFLSRHAISPGSLGYVECQAVGSPLGDAAELSGLTRALGPAPAAPLPVGSLKGAIGHLEAASGAAQVTRVLGMLQRRVLMPTAGLEGLHPDVMQACAERLEVCRALRPWPDPAEGPRRALVQSFGAGGSCAFAVLEQTPIPAPPAHTPRLPGGRLVFPVSARSETALETTIRRLGAFLEAQSPGPNPAAVAWTLQQGRAALEHRVAMLATDLDELIGTLQDVLDGRPGAWHRGVRRPGAGNGKGLDAADPDALARYWAEGHTVDWQALWSDPGPSITPVSLPPYPFEHRRCWFAPPPETEAREPGPVAEALPDTRRVVLLTGPGEPEDLEFATRPLAPPRAGELLIRVHACGLNFADLLCLRGLHPNLEGYPYVPGFEVAGTVVAWGPGVTGYSPGQAVIALTGGRGGQADLVCVPEHWATACPDGIEPALAAASPVGYLTMSHALERASLGAGETVLIQSAAGGVGPIGVQLALDRGARVIATAGSPQKLAALARLGVEDLINYRTEDFAARTRQLTGGRGVDVVLNTLGGDAIQQGIDLLAPGGRYVEIALAGLRSAGPLDLSRLMDNQTLITVNLGRLLADPGQSRAGLTAMAQDLAAGRFRPLISEVFPGDRLAQAYLSMDRRENVGKVVIAFPDDEHRLPQRRATPNLRPRPAPKAPEILEVLTRLAAEILGLEPREIDPPRPLDELGLNSVAAVALMRGVHQTLGLGAPVGLLYQAGSLQALAQRLAALTAQEQGPPPTSDGAPADIGDVITQGGEGAGDLLVPIQSGSGTPSYWVHGATGDASWVTRLAPVLGPEQTVFGLQARGMDGRAAPRRRVATMARDYVRALRERQPRGPYRLGGYSGGGILAYEMARQLADAGERVERLVLLDAYAPGNTALTRMDEVYGEGFVFLLATNWFGRRWGLSRRLTPQDLQGINRQAQLGAALDHLYRYARPDLERTRLEAYLTGMERVGRAAGQALRAYRAEPLDPEVDALLIRCSGGMSGPDNPYGLPELLLEADYTLGWETLLPHLRVETLDCDHFTLLDDPHRKRAGAAVRRFFDGGADAPPAAAPDADLRTTVLGVLEAEIRRVLGDLPAGAIVPGARLVDLGAHSIDRAEIATAAMERLDVVVPPTALAQVADIDGLVDLLTLHAESGGPAPS